MLLFRIYIIFFSFFSEEHNINIFVGLNENGGLRNELNIYASIWHKAEYAVGNEKF